MNWNSAPRLYLILLGINIPSPFFLWLTLNGLGYEIGFLICVLIVLMLVAISLLTALFIRTLPLWINSADGWMNITEGVPEEGKVIIAFYHGHRRLLVRHGVDWYEAQEFNGLSSTPPDETVWRYLPRAPVKES